MIKVEVIKTLDNKFQVRLDNFSNEDLTLLELFLVDSLSLDESYSKLSLELLEQLKVSIRGVNSHPLTPAKE